MRIIWGIICLALLAIPVHSRPKPPPPSDFRGDIYVDSHGCAFKREDRKWVARKVDGKAICGFPPSSSSLRLDASKAAPSPPSMGQIEQDLVGIIASGLRQGEAVADDREREHIDPAPSVTGQDKFTAELIAMASIDSKLQTALSGSFNANEICSRLGYQAKLHPRPVLGWDVTMGLCPEARATTPRKRISHNQPLESPATDNKKVTNASLATGDAVSTQAAKTLPDQDDIQPHTKPRSRPATIKRQDQPKVTLTDNVGPSAPSLDKRYVEVGRFHDDQSAGHAIRQLTRLGHPAAQAYRRENRQTVRIIYAGPFDDPAALNSALVRLRSEGYLQANIR